MKNLIQKSAILALIMLVGSAFTIKSNEGTEWDSKTIDFAEVKMGEKISRDFTFTNTSDQPITIIKTKASCGCTVSSHTKGEIAPGEKGKVSAEYTARNLGQFQKSITVYTSASEQPIRLMIKGNVIP